MNKILKTPLTNFDIKKYLGDDTFDNIIKYSDLDDYTDLEELLPYDKSYKIILIEYDLDQGHWICISRYGKTIEIFNSFGTKHDDDDFEDNDVKNEYLGQSELYLDKLINKEVIEMKFNLIYNKIRFQEKSHEINTCGRHVINRLLCLINFNLNLQQYIELMKLGAKTKQLSYDELVSKIIT
jgi:hypothetical protein